MELTKREPEVHVRIAHVHTLKDGWRLGETTVSYDGPIIDWDAINESLVRSYEDGVAETQRRNDAER